MNQESGLSSDGRALLAAADKEAERLGHEYVGTEHILLAMVAHDETPLTALFHDLAIDGQRVRNLIETTVKRGSPAPYVLKNRPYTSRTYRVLTLAKESAATLGKAEAGGVHLLLGLLHEGRGIAAQVLTAERVSIETATAALMRQG
jgi:ATP-dependent Clp protease ATP-binding subunit ClpC